MFKKILLITWFIVSVSAATAQESKTDSLALLADDALFADTTVDYEALFAELDLFLDSLLAPRSYILTSLSIGQGYFNYIPKNSYRATTVKKYAWTPTFGFYDKSGFGITLTGYMVKDNESMNMYQVSASPSYDYLKDRKLAAGISYLRYFNTDSTSFYTSPLQNEINGYFLWRKSWLQPGISANYGWGSRTELQKRERIIEVLRNSDRLYTSTNEYIVDFSLTASLRHDFYWLNIFSKRDYIRFTPQLSFAGGTQKFGFNQTTGTYGINGYNVLYRAGSVTLDQKKKFRPLSLTLYLRADYSVGNFFLQPQVLFDYYFPGETQNFTSLFSINTGFMF